MHLLITAVIATDKSLESVPKQCTATTETFSLWEIKHKKKKSPSYVLQMAPFPTCKKLTYESFLLSRLLRNSSITITQRHLKYSYSKHNNFLTFWNNSSKIMLLSNHNDKCSSSSFLFSFILVLGGILPQSSAKSFASFPLLWRAQQQCSVHRKTTVLLLYLTNCIFTPS